MVTNFLPVKTVILPDGPGAPPIGVSRAMSGSVVVTPGITASRVAPSCFACGVSGYGAGETRLDVDGDGLAEHRREFGDAIGAPILGGLLRVVVLDADARTMRAMRRDGRRGGQSQQATIDRRSSFIASLRVFALRESIIDAKSLGLTAGGGNPEKSTDHTRQDAKKPPRIAPAAASVASWQNHKPTIVKEGKSR
jgi:hypothetical protein